MKIVAALTDAALAAAAQEQGAGMVELRLDLMDGDPAELVRQVRSACTLPVIATLRSAREGGRYGGAVDEWFGCIRPILADVDYVDVEQQFSSSAVAIKEAGKKVVASYHTGGLPALADLFFLERELRLYGDIVKIVVTPATKGDLIDLIAFTHAIKQPLCTVVMGPEFRSARLLLPLFGSELVYCHVGTPTASGQYSVEEFVALTKMLGHL